MSLSLFAQVLPCRKPIEISDCHFYQYQKRGNFSQEKFLWLPAYRPLGLKIRQIQIYVLQTNILFHSFCHPHYWEEQTTSYLAIQILETFFLQDQDQLFLIFLSLKPTSLIKAICFCAIGNSAPTYPLSPHRPTQGAFALDVGL